MPQPLDADAVRRWAAASARCVAEQADAMNAVNVFPVADADTGSNLTATTAGGRAAVDQLWADAGRGSAPSADDALRAWAQGSVLAARGNSGVILSQYLVGFADGCDAGEGGADAAAVAGGLRAGALRARAAVADPVAGTIVSVADAAAQAESTGLNDLVTAAVTLAHAALRVTTHQLPALARAGVVDAGGLGLVVVLEALAEVVTGRSWAGALPPAPPSVTARPRPGRAVAQGVVEPATPSGQVVAESRFEVQYLLRAADESAAVDGLRGALVALGDSVSLGQAPDGTWAVHVHVGTAAIGAVVEAGLAAGRPYRIEISPLPPDPDGPDPAEAVEDGVAILALVAPGGLAALFTAERAEVVPARPDGEVGLEDVLAAIVACPHRQVIVLPNGAASSAVAIEAATRARSLGRRVIVVPTRSPVQGLAALAVHDPARDLEDDVVAMAEAAAATRYAEVVRAERRALTSVGVCEAGDLLGLIDGEVVEIGHGLVSVGFAVLDRLLGVGAELITIVLGGDAAAGTGQVLRRHVQERAALTDVTVYSGGQPRQLLLIGAE